MRRDPVYLDVTPGFSTEHLFLGRTQKEAMVLAKLREVYPSVRTLHYPKSPSGKFTRFTYPFDFKAAR